MHQPTCCVPSNNAIVKIVTAYSVLFRSHLQSFLRWLSCFFIENNPSRRSRPERRQPLQRISRGFTFVTPCLSHNFLIQLVPTFITCSLRSSRARRPRRARTQGRDSLRIGYGDMRAGTLALLVNSQPCHARGRGVSRVTRVSSVWRVLAPPLRRPESMALTLPSSDASLSL